MSVGTYSITSLNNSISISIWTEVGIFEPILLAFRIDLRDLEAAAKEK